MNTVFSWATHCRAVVTVDGNPSPFHGGPFMPMPSLSVWCATGALAWPGSEVQLAVIVPEKLATALRATNTVADFSRQGAANDQAQDFREATSRPLAGLQSTWRGGGSSASCTACPYLVLVAKADLKHLD